MTKNCNKNTCTIYSMTPARSNCKLHNHRYRKRNETKVTKIEQWSPLGSGIMSSYCINASLSYVFLTVDMQY